MPGRAYAQIWGTIFPIDGAQDTNLADGATVTSNAIDITDIHEDPATGGLPDFGEALGIRYTQSWILGWSVFLDFVPIGAFAGSQFQGFWIRFEQFSFSGTYIETGRLRLPITSIGATQRQLYQGDTKINGRRARIVLENQTGANLRIYWLLWAKAW